MKALIGMSESSKEWVPESVNCHKAQGAESPCQFILGRLIKRKLIGMKGPETLSYRQYKCKKHTHGTVDLLNPRVLTELGKQSDISIISITKPCVKNGQMLYCADLALFVYLTYIDSGHNAAFTRRAIESLWLAHMVDASLQGRDFQQVDLNELPSPKCIESLVRAMHTHIPPSTIATVDHDDEGQCLRWDATYGAAKNIGVVDGKRWLKVAYCLGSILGKSGTVLHTRFLPSEKSDALEPCFNEVFARQSAAPKFVFFDDIKKWHILCRAWIASHFGDEAAQGVLLGQDVEHWKKLLLTPIDESHADYQALLRDLNAIVNRLLGYKLVPEQGFYLLATQVRDDVRRVFEHYQKAHSTTLVKGARFVATAEFGLCKALGKALGKESCNPKNSFRFNLRELKETTAQNGILAAADAKATWTSMKDEPEWYYEALLVSTKCVQAKIVPGTNMDEGWHNALHRDCHFGGRKGLPLANVEVSTCQAFFNYAVITNDNVPVSHSRPDPVTDAYGNDQQPRMKKRRIPRQDNRAEVLARMAMAVQSMGGWIPLMVAVSAYQKESPTLASLKDQGYQVRFSNRQALTSAEKDTIHTALHTLASEGAVAMGRYKKVCRWIARCCLQGTRSELKVGEYVRQLVKAQVNKRRSATSVRGGVAIASDRDAEIENKAMDVDCQEAVGALCDLEKESSTWDLEEDDDLEEDTDMERGSDVDCASLHPESGEDESTSDVAKNIQGGDANDGSISQFDFPSDSDSEPDATKDMQKHGLEDADISKLECKIHPDAGVDAKLPKKIGIVGDVTESEDAVAGLIAQVAEKLDITPYSALDRILSATIPGLSTFDGDAQVDVPEHVAQHLQSLCNGGRFTQMPAAKISWNRTPSPCQPSESLPIAAFGDCGIYSLLYFAMPEQFSPPPINPSPLQCAIALSLRRTLPEPTPYMKNLDVDELVALAERLGVQLTLRVCCEDKWHTILAPLAVDHKTHVTIQFADDHYSPVRVVQTEHDASPMAIDPETHGTASIHHHSPLPPVHEVDQSVHDTSSHEHDASRMAIDPETHDTVSTHHHSPLPPVHEVDQSVHDMSSHEHDASPMAIDPETHDTVSIPHHSPLPPVHEVDQSVHDTPSQIVTRLALRNDSTHPMNTAYQAVLESLGTKYATVGHGVDVRSSRLKGGGQGLFASQPYKTNDDITFMAGTLLRHATCKDLQGHRRAYLRTLMGQDMVLDGIPCKDLTERQGAASAANDAEPYNNAFFKETFINGHVPICLLVAKCDVAIGDEIFVSYGKTYWEQSRVKRKRLRKDPNLVCVCAMDLSLDSTSV